MLWLEKTWWVWSEWMKLTGWVWSEWKSMTPGMMRSWRSFEVLCFEDDLQGKRLSRDNI